MALKPDASCWPEGEKNSNYLADVKDVGENPHRWDAAAIIPEKKTTFKKPDPVKK